MKGGYQIIDLSTALVGSDSVIKGIYQTIKHFDGKPVFIITPHNSGVFAEFMENNGTYIGSYIGSNSHLFTVSITPTNHVTIADNDVQGAIAELNSKTEHNADTSSYITIPTDGTEYTVQQPGIFELIVYTSTEQWSAADVVVNGIRRYGIENRNDKGIGGSFSMNLYPGDVIRITLSYGAGVSRSRMFVIS